MAIACIIILLLLYPIFVIAGKESRKEDGF